MIKVDKKKISQSMLGPSFFGVGTNYEEMEDEGEGTGH
jgi:hypothetical protein